MATPTTTTTQPPAVDKLAVRKRVYKRAIAYLSRRKLPLGINAVKPDMFAAVDALVDFFEQLDLREILPEGPVKSEVNVLYLTRLAAIVFKEISEEQKDALAEYEAAQQTKMQAVMSVDGEALQTDA